MSRSYFECPATPIFRRLRSSFLYTILVACFNYGDPTFGSFSSTCTGSALFLTKIGRISLVPLMWRPSFPFSFINSGSNFCALTNGCSSNRMSNPRVEQAPHEGADR